LIHTLTSAPIQEWPLRSRSADTNAGWKANYMSLSGPGWLLF